MELQRLMMLPQVYVVKREAVKHNASRMACVISDIASLCLFVPVKGGQHDEQLAAGPAELTNVHALWPLQCRRSVQFFDHFYLMHH